MWPAWSIWLLLALLCIRVVIGAGTAGSTQLQKDIGLEAQRLPHGSYTGAIKGTGMAILQTKSGARFYFQHASGQIREAFQQRNSWRGGAADDVVVANNIGTGTPIAAVTYHEGADYVVS